MSRMSKRSELEKEKKTYQCVDRVTVLSLECDKNGQVSESGSVARRGQETETGGNQHRKDC